MLTCFITAAELGVCFTTAEFVTTAEFFTTAEFRDVDADMLYYS